MTRKPMHRENVTTCVALAVVLCLSAVGHAEAQRGIDVERFTPSLEGDGFLGIQATRTPGPGRWNFGLWTTWSTNPLVLRAPDDSEIDVIDHRVTADLQFQIGIGGRLALAIDLPLVLHQDAAGELLGDGLGAIPSNAPGDPRLVARYRFLGQDSRIERERNEGEGVAVQVAGTIPVGDEDAFGSEHGVTTELHALADFHVLGAGAAAMLGWRHRFETRDLLGVTFRDEIELGVALKLPVPVTQDFFAILEVRGVTDAGNPFGEQSTTVVEGDLGLRIRRGDLTVTGGVGSGWTGGVGSPAFRSMLGLAWAPRVRDSDGDGIPDDRDECAFLPEDFDGFEDSDGCLDPDNDNDLIPDLDDLCPDEEAEEFRDEDEDGCTDPLADADRDEVEDSVDACPEQPEDLDGHQDDDGCPDPDNDGDGVEDARDGCADEPEDVDEHDDADGCPDPDDDRDGVVDAEDRCPDGAETINGVSDEDGCPDRGGRSLWRVENAGEPEERLTGTIAFSAQNTLGERSAGAVDQLARQLIARWPTRYQIQLGTASAAGAQALIEALTQRGVPAGRVGVREEASLRGARVVVTRAPLEQDAPQVEQVESAGDSGGASE